MKCYSALHEYNIAASNEIEFQSISLLCHYRDDVNLNLENLKVTWYILSINIS